MTESDLKKFFPYASKSTFARNAGVDSPPPSPEPERSVCHDALAEAPREERYPSRVVVRIVSFRTRLLDADNLVGGSKYFTDGLRYAGLISGDAEAQIRLEVSQRKVQSKAEECTRIEIEPIAPTPVQAMTRAELIEAYWANCSSSWNRPAFDVFMETLDEEALRQYIQMGTT